MTGTMREALHRSEDELEAALAQLTAAPADAGTIELIVARPAEDQRRRLSDARLDVAVGLVGDNWQDRPSRRTTDGRAHPDMQLNVINARLSRFVAFGDDDRAALAGDQLHLDLDLSEENLPAGTLLHLGAVAVIEVTDQPHTGCAKFTERFGLASHRFVNSEVGRAHRLRGLNARVVVPGAIAVGDEVRVERRGVLFAPSTA